MGVGGFSERDFTGVGGAGRSQAKHWSWVGAEQRGGGKGV